MNKLTPYQMLIYKIIKRRKAGVSTTNQEQTEQLESLTKDEPQQDQYSLDTDYSLMCREIQKKENCTLVEAMRRVDKICPMARQKYIDDANRVPEGPLYSGELDPKDYMKIIRHYRKDYKCGRIEAMRMIDEDHPGLREAYIKKVNER